MKSPITTHVLDTSKGCPAQGVPVKLEKVLSDGGLKDVAQGETDNDGRIIEWFDQEGFEAGVYRLTFDTSRYMQQDTFYPLVSIHFDVKDAEQHYHVPLLLSPFGYSTYRGS